MPTNTMAQSDSSNGNVNDEAAGTAKERWAQWGAIGIFAVNTLGLGLFHYHGNDPTTQRQPDDLPIQSPLDKLFFGVLVLMAFELLDFLTKHSGSKCQIRKNGFVHRVCSANVCDLRVPHSFHVIAARCGCVRE
jgi:hypothetical protein